MMTWYDYLILGVALAIMATLIFSPSCSKAHDGHHRFSFEQKYEVRSIYDVPKRKVQTQSLDGKRLMRIQDYEKEFNPIKSYDSTRQRNN